MLAIYSVLLFWLLPAAVIERRTALVLLCAWCAAQAAGLVTGDELPIWLYIPADLVSIAFILLWAPKGSWAAVRASRDWWIIGLYPVEWACYALIQERTPLWLALCILTLAQFIIAGPWKDAARAVDALTGFRRVN